VYIPQAWLSEEWDKIHGARIVWISRLKKNKNSIRNVARYFISQYLGGQSAVVRVSWSWWRSRVAIGKAWVSFKRLFGQGDFSNPWAGLNWRVREVSRLDKLKAWDEFLLKGCVKICGMEISIIGRSLSMERLGDAEFE
jgi:hypothetical protein